MDLNKSFGIFFASFQWPWMVSIGYDNSTGYHHLCGGALIDNSHVLNAAHCLYSGLDLGRLSLVLGTLDYTSYTGHRIDRSIKTVQTHPKYNNGTYLFMKVMKVLGIKKTFM